MFTGLVEEVGDVIGLDGARLTVAARLVLEDGALARMRNAVPPVVERRRGPARLRSRA